MKLRNPRLISLAAVAVAILIRVWMATVRCRVINGDRAIHPGNPDVHRYIYAFWHESFLAPVKFRSRVRVLISKHADGELVAQACRYLGFGVVRGSTNRGGGPALVELWDCSRAAHLVFTPDGPRGPRRKVQPGIIMLAARSGLPIVPVGVGFRRAWRAGSWDRFALPWPFSVCVYHVGAAIQIPSELDRQTLEHYRGLVETRFLEVTEAAERLAAVDFQGPRPHFRSNGLLAHRSSQVSSRNETSEANPSGSMMDGTRNSSLRIDETKGGEGWSDRNSAGS
ncbi:MAG: hypothetical protein NVSMB9_37130 [Isosphaeraceae bacterium]